ncbi:SUF system NifU family Fe-S cluster assembly protein [Treponema phagedenis]|uniref:SUF system FeS assembly protein, NifU family n=1 Tax=Treponema phagedenis TaxID=162 RepID=A0A0B7GW79_TREPH|nr:SUF system NifU family Fe-S cluster assembly protein [Treponema phagedenis]NVP23857.1 SUF system NifU family Fe-S cluster assembly protein [Treponema phagedenis]QEJ96351.1 SUF system NifU family Fe-S cluster assembly protein [Treponema phagedenis]QEJ99510.1 SUF system NifU family Fe-S cluster assembly protein [Treponema phagedenis]QEK02149.1 SUF system NifU family Fe-S cluster assembly protein [Treponema phagedenis]QEK05081.1 SUF system NifU family Fe-S cluster assembly protein [Treponema p
MDIDTIYQQTILEYSRNKEHKHELEGQVKIERGHNPSCGDDLTLLLKEENGIIQEASFLGTGCAISTASTNMLIELIEGKPVEEAKQKIAIFFKMMNKEPVGEEEKDLLEDAQILEYFASMPARIKCATLSWHSADVLLNKEK